MTNHTPGPWFTSTPNEGGGILIKPIPGQVVAQCDELPEMEANACLIASAPELLEALESMVLLAMEMFEHWDSDNEPKVGKYLLAISGQLPGYDKRTDELHASIAKARGEV